jgi:hypothetical protein
MSCNRKVKYLDFYLDKEEQKEEQKKYHYGNYGGIFSMELPWTYDQALILGHYHLRN